MKSETPTIVWKCTQCDKEFKYESEKRRHEQSHVPQFECQVCSKKFSFVSALRRHEKQHNRTVSVLCSKCKGKFRDETLLQRHMQYAHRGKHKCKKCSATLNSKLALHTHMKTHKPEAERKYRCSFEGCSKTFNFAHHLKHHQLTHTEDKPHICMECGKGFIQQHHLKIHQRVHKPESWLTCTVVNCKKEFTNEYALRRHIATHKNKYTLKTSSDSAANTKKLKITKIEDHGHTHKDAQSTKKEISETGLLEKEPAVITVTGACHQNKIVTETRDMKAYNLEKQKNEIVDLKTAGNFKVYNSSLLCADENEDICGLDLSIADCKSVLGKCIVTGDIDANESCLCAQMDTQGKTDFSEFPPENNNVIHDSTDNLKCIEKRLKDMNACETCECASICGIKENFVKFEIPKLEKRNDGIIKIKDTFDIDIESLETDHANIFFANKFEFKVRDQTVSSCKDILGNCIVSGDGEGCLCARMTADDQQNIAQEIDDITPCPKSTSFAI